MATEVTTKLLTAEEFMAADLGDGTFELVRGEVDRIAASDAGTWRVCANVAGIARNLRTPDGLRLRLVK